MRSLLLAFTTTICLAVPVAAQAADWKTGDVFVGTSTGQYNVYGNGGTLLETIDQGVATTGVREAVDCAFDRSGVLHTAAFRFTRVVRFLAPHPHAQLTAVTTGAAPESIAFARDGSYYVGHQANPDSLRRFTGDGTAAGTFTPASPASLIDLSADQRTVFYTDRSAAAVPRVHRFDVATGKNLADFGNLGGTGRIADIKLLPPGDGSGGAIVAQSTAIKRLDGAGKVVKTYDRPGLDTWFGIALDPDGRSFWAQTSAPGSVFRFNIATGAVDRGPLPAAGSAFGICVNGTLTAALDNAPPRIDVTTPADGAIFQQGQRVAAAYTCTDDANGTGIDRCAGPVAPGEPIDTGAPGPKTFTVTATDVAGNTASATRSYQVAPPAPAAPPAPPLPRIEVTLSTGFEPITAVTTFNLLIVRDVPRGSRVTATCKRKSGKSCGIRRFTSRRAHGDVKLKRFLHRPLRPGTVIEVRVTKRGAIGAVKQIKTRFFKRPKLSSRCLPPGAKRPVRC